jgi:hypothetical protein
MLAKPQPYGPGNPMLAKPQPYGPSKLMLAKPNPMASPHRIPRQNTV